MADHIGRYARWLLALILLTAAPALAGDRFVDNGDGTITDNRLGLMWSQSDNQGDIDWHQANRWVRYTFSDTLPTFYDNWRLPTIDELESLYVREKNGDGVRSDCGMTVHIAPVFHLSCGWVWSSEASSITARGFHYDSGWILKDRMVLKKGYRALPVRDIK